MEERSEFLFKNTRSPHIKETPREMPTTSLFMIRTFQQSSMVETLEQTILKTDFLHNTSQKSMTPDRQVFS